MGLDCKASIATHYQTLLVLESAPAACDATSAYIYLHGAQVPITSTQNLSKNYLRYRFGWM